MSGILITGGTGTLGTQFIKQTLEKEPNTNICVYSRDEFKQKKLASEFPGVRCMLGDIRDKERVTEVFKRVKPSTVYHFAAMKHVDLGESMVTEFVKTNYDGTVNVFRACQEAEVSRMVFSSTDKAVMPINAYGMSKGLAEKFLCMHDGQRGVLVDTYRWGNVLASRGSVIHSFVRTLKEEGKLYVTHPEMTRFWIKMRDACELMMGTDFTQTCKDGIAIVPDETRIKACSVEKLALTVASLMGKESNYRIDYTGMRPGEKIHENLWVAPGGELTLRSDDPEWQYTYNEIKEIVKELI